MCVYRPSSCWARNRSAAISAYVTPPRKNTSVTFWSAILDWEEVMEVPVVQITWILSNIGFPTSACELIYYKLCWSRVPNLYWVLFAHMYKEFNDAITEVLFDKKQLVYSTLEVMKLYFKGFRFIVNSLCHLICYVGLL